MPNEAELSEREREILRLAATGASNKEIARELFISTNTVKVHLRNIFAKVGVASRTEATLYAIRAGIAPPPLDFPLSAPVDNAALTGQEFPTHIEVENPEIMRRRPGRIVVMFSVFLLAAAGILGVTLLRPNPSVVATVTPQPTLSRWQERAPLPEARAGLAAAVYENQIYAIAGETESGVTGAVTRYDPVADAWTTLTSKPMPVADVGAALIGEKIYVPGGRLASGQMSDLLEVYDPRRDTWETRARLPKPISAYSLAAFEGRLYLFGGTDGQEVLDTVYEYDPSSDTWTHRTNMPTKRSFSGAAAVGGKIFVIGGWDGEKALAVNEAYYPQREGAGENPWEEKQPLPLGRFGIGVTGLAENVYIGGGDLDSTIADSVIIFDTRSEQWMNTEPSPVLPRKAFGLVSLQTNIYTIGGMTTDYPIQLVLTYRAIYTVSIPALTK